MFAPAFSVLTHPYGRLSTQKSKPTVDKETSLVYGQSLMPPVVIDQARVSPPAYHRVQTRLGSTFHIGTLVNTVNFGMKLVVLV